MQRALLLVRFFVLIGFAGCIPCETTVTDSAQALRPDFDREIDACVTKHSCMLLCRDLFQLDPSIQIESCQVTKVQATSANVIVTYYDASSCTSGGDGIDIGLGDSGDDSGDDGSTDGSDGGSDGSTSGSDDGSGSDTGSDTGSDGGGSDDGSPRKAPGHREIRDATISR